MSYIAIQLEDEKKDLEQAEKALQSLLYRTEIKSAKFTILNDVTIKVQGLLFRCLKSIRMDKGIKGKVR